MDDRKKVKTEKNQNQKKGGSFAPKYRKNSEQQKEPIVINLLGNKINLLVKAGYDATKIAFGNRIC